MHEIKKIDNHFYQPRDAYRTSVSNCQPVFNFNLSEIDESTVYKLQIMDSKGGVVVTYSSGGEEEEEEESDAKKDDRKLEVKKAK